MKRVLTAIMLISLTLLIGCSSTDKNAVSFPYVITREGSYLDDGTHNPPSVTRETETPAEAEAETETQTPAPAPAPAAEPEAVPETEKPAVSPSAPEEEAAEQDRQTASEEERAPLIEAPLPTYADFFDSTGNSVPDYNLLPEGDEPVILSSSDLGSSAANQEASYFTLLYTASHQNSDIESYGRRTAIDNSIPLVIYSTSSRYDGRANLLFFAPMDPFEMMEYSIMGIRCEDGAEGATVRTVFIGTPAEGVIERGDIITSVNGNAISSLSDYEEVTDPIINGNDKEVTITYRRSGAENTVTLVL